MEKQTLFNIAAELGHLSEKQVRHIAIQLVQAVSQLNRHDIAHRDIKLSNICFPFDSSTATTAEAEEGSLRQYQQMKSSNAILSQNQFKFKIKLIDFGMAGFVQEDGLLRGRCGTLGCVAPEILNCTSQEGYTLACDMYSVSCPSLPPCAAVCSLL